MPKHLNIICWSMLLGVAAALCGGVAQAGSLTDKDVQVAAKAMAFLDPPTQSGVIAIVYSDPGSKADADATVALFGDGVTGGSASLTAKAVDAAGLGDGSGYVGIILAQGADAAAAISAAKSHHIPCITGDIAAVQSGGCIVAIKSSPKVNITVSHSAASAAGVSFSASFRMLINEI